MDEKKETRWKQRFSNLKKASDLLLEALEIKTPSDLEKQGTIQRFEFTFELAWKTLKDYLESQDVPVRFPREVIKESFQSGIIQNGEIWMKMLADRNLLSHTYNEENSEQAYSLIAENYSGEIYTLVKWFSSQI